jgi:hypothetical protein
MKTLKCTYLLSMLMLLTAMPGRAQLVNGSFETSDSLASLSGWTFTCTAGESLALAAPQTGKWSLKQASGNTQGCFPGYVYQTIPQADSGQIWQLAGWARTDSFSPPPATIGIFFARIDSFGEIHLLKGDTTSASAWTALTVRDTLRLGKGDTLAVVLDPGLTGGPVLGLAYFDGLSLDSLGTTGLFPKRQLEGVSLQLRPHPMAQEGWIDLDLEQGTWLNLALFDLQGRRLQAIAQGRYAAGVHSFRIDTRRFAPGIYLLFLRTPEGIMRKRLAVGD